MARRIISLIICLSFIFQQTGFAQAATLELNLAGHLSRLNNNLTLGSFRPVHLRYFSYDLNSNNFKVLLDKGSEKNLSKEGLENSTQELLKYFLIGVTLPDDTFWVNLRPDSADQIIEDVLTKTDVGKIMLETDLQLKKDTAAFTSPQTIEGKEYWNKLYKKAEELYGTDAVTIPTVTRPWIVPNEVIVREAEGSAYIYKATLKVMLEADYIKSSNSHLNTVDYSFKDQRSKALNEYSTQLIRELIIPKLTKEVNTSKNYAALRQVFYSLVLSRWFKLRFAGKAGTYPSLIDKQDLTNLASTQSWDKSTYFNAYKKSFAQGEYNIKETHYTPTGQVIRSYFSGGVQMIIPQNGLGGTSDIAAKLGQTLASRSGNAAGNVALSPIAVISSSPMQIRTDFTVPEGQKADFFTTVRHEYRISELFAKPVNIIPDAVVNAVKAKLGQDKAEGKILSAMVDDFGATGIDIQVTHRYGELNAAVERVIMEAMKEGCLKAQELGLLKKDIDISSMDLRMLAKAMRMKHRTHSITERGAEPVVIGKIIGAGIGAANIKLFHQFFMPGSTPQRKLGYLPKVANEKKAGVRGFRAIVRKTEDVLKGNYDGKVWEFENCAEGWVGDKHYPSVDQREELLALASQPNEYLITAVYAVEGSKLPSTEPLVSVVYQPVYGEEGGLRTLDPTFIFRSQSGADAVGGIARIIYDVNFVPGGSNGENYVVTKPATLKEARKAPKKGTAHAVVYGYQSEGIGKIPWETGEVIDHVAINPPAVAYQRKLADQLAKVMITHENDQPYLTPFAAEVRVAPLREAQSHLFLRAPKETEVDPFMEKLELKVARGEMLSIDDMKADMGGSFGHNFTPVYMLAINKASLMEATENKILTDGNIIGFADKNRLPNGRTMAVGDDTHMMTFGDRSPNSKSAKQLGFTSLTRCYLASMIGNNQAFDPAKPFDKTLAKQPYGRGQDFTGKEAKAAKTHPYFYSQFTVRFFEILREIMPTDYLQMVDNMEKGWRHWKSTQSEGITLAEPFSGNVSQQGMGTARLILDIAGGEREFGILAGDKMGPAALNRPIWEGLKLALAAGEFKNGVVLEIQDAKAYDEHGNIPIEELPQIFGDVEESITALKKASDQDFVKSCYKDGWIRNDLTDSKKEDLSRLLKESGYVPNKRIFLDAKQDKKAIDTYLADSDRFNVKQVWEKSKPGWDINKPQDYLERPILGSSITKLGILAGGEYIGKDDPVMLGQMKLMKHIFEFLRTEPLIIQGDMNGSHWLAAIPTAFKYLVANAESHPILGGWVYTLSKDGNTVASIKDVFDNKAYSNIRSKMFEFNHKFMKAQLGGQFEPYGTNRRTVEASYPLAKLLNAIEAEDSPFLVNNKPPESRTTRPIGMLGTRVELFDRATRIATSPVQASSPVKDKKIGDQPAANFAIAKMLASKTTALGSDTVRVDIELAGGAKGYYIVPAGTSTGARERATVGVAQALKNIQKIHEAVTSKGLKAHQLVEIAQVMFELDKQETLGAEATLGYQMAAAWAAARQQGLELYEFLGQVAPDLAVKGIPKTKIQYNITNGGEHAENSLDMQEFMIKPVGETTADENEMCDKIDEQLGLIYQALGLKADPYDKGVGKLRGKEGGYKIEDLTIENLKNIYANAASHSINNLNIQALAEAKIGVHEFVLNCKLAAIKNAGYTPSTSGEVGTVAFALDTATTSMLVEGNSDLYNYEGTKITSDKLIGIFYDWVYKKDPQTQKRLYPIDSIEDGLGEDDWNNWIKLVKAVGDDVLIIGDDLLVTQGSDLMKLIKMLDAAGLIKNGKVTKRIGILIKLNQNGFLTTGINSPEEGYLGTLEVMRLAKQYGIEYIISHRSKEAEAREREVSIAHLAALGAYALKSGDHVQDTRAVKENESGRIDARERVKAEFVQRGVDVDSFSGRIALLLREYYNYSYGTYESVRSSYGPELEKLKKLLDIQVDISFSNFAKRATIRNAEHIWESIVWVRAEMRRSVKDYEKDDGYVALGWMSDKLARIIKVEKNKQPVDAKQIQATKEVTKKEEAKAPEPPVETGVVSSVKQVEVKNLLGAEITDILEHLNDLYFYGSMKPYGPELNKLLGREGLEIPSLMNFGDFAKRANITHARMIHDMIWDLQLDMIRNLEGYNNDEAYVELCKLEKELAKIILDASSASSPSNRPADAGGIDFRKQAMASVTAYKPMGTFIGLNAKLPEMSKSTLAKFNLDKVAAHIESMLSAKILFDETIIMEYMAASIAKGELANRKGDVITWLAKLGMLQEELDCCQESSAQYRQALVLVEKYATI